MYKDQEGVIRYDDGEPFLVKFEVELGCQSVFVETWRDARLLCKSQYGISRTPPEAKPKDGRWISDDGYIIITPTDAQSVFDRYDGKNEIQVVIEMDGYEMVYSEVGQCVPSGSGTPGIKCLKCGKTSYSPSDIQYKFCVVCDRFHKD